MTARDSYANVGAAMREALWEATHADPPLGRIEWKVLAGVLSYAPSWSRLQDRVKAKEIAEVAGLSLKETKRKLASLCTRGIIVYEPAQGRGRRSLIGLPPARERGRACAPLLDAEKGRAFEGKGARNGSENGRGPTPGSARTEKFREFITEGSASTNNERRTTPFCEHGQLPLDCDECKREAKAAYEEGLRKFRESQAGNA